MKTPPAASTRKVRDEVDALNQSSWDIAQSDPRAALDLARKAIRKSDDSGYLEGKAEGLLNCGWALIYTADFGEALRNLHESLDIHDSLDIQGGRLKVLNALGVIAHRVGDSERALERFRETLDIARTTGNRDRLLAALNNLGELSASLGHAEEALGYYEEAREVAEEQGLPGVLAVVKVNLASVHRLIGEPETALGFVQDGIVLAREAGDSISEAEGTSTLGLIQADGGDPESAEESHRHALELAEATGHPRGVITVLNNLGGLYMETGRLDEAREALQRASELAERIGTPLESLPAYTTLANLYEESGDLQDALDLRKRISALQRDLYSEGTVKRMTAMRTEHELERSRSEAEIFRLRNVEMREKAEELEAANRRLELISELGREVTSTLVMEDLLDLLHRRVNSLMEAAVFGIAFYDDEKQMLDYALFIEDGERVPPITHGIDTSDSFGAWAVRNQKEVVIQDAEKEYKAYVRKRKPLTGTHAKSIVYLPLMIESRVVGLMTVQTHKKHGYSNEQVEVLRTLASYVAIALDNSRKHATIQDLSRTVLQEKSELERAYDRIAHLANHDNLTELPNRRLITELLNEHIPLARRQRKQFGVLYLDLDDFKPVNDTFGHAAGDVVLKHIAERLKGAVRSSDTVARIGGDEFVLLVRDVEARGALETIADKVLEAVRAPVAVEGQKCTIGASIGISVFPRDGETADSLLGAADQAMYVVKDKGKAGVQFASVR